MTPYYQDDWVTIYHGDCREIASALVGVDALVTDPPYGIGLHGDRTSIGGRIVDPIVGDDQPFDPQPWITYQHVVLFGANYYADRLPKGRWIVWNKRDVMVTRMLTSDAEVIWHNGPGRPVEVFNWFWHGAYRTGEMGSYLHPAQKPLALMRWLIGRTAGVVLDPYMGSGSTIRAAKDVSRRAIGIEIEERYCEIAAQRCSQETLGLLTTETR